MASFLVQARPGHKTVKYVFFVDNGALYAIDVEAEQETDP